MRRARLHRGADGAEGVVLVHVGQAEHGHHRIADELLRPSAERRQFLGGGVEEAAQQLASSFGVEALGQAGRIDQVGEEDRDHLSLLCLDQGTRGRSAVRAVTRRLGKRQPANRARPHHGCRICCTGWPTPSLQP